MRKHGSVKKISLFGLKSTFKNIVSGGGEIHET